MWAKWHVAVKEATISIIKTGMGAHKSNTSGS